MRTKLLILSLVFCLNSFAQVPNNETFSFCGHVAPALSKACAGYGLNTAFGDANSSFFDPRYYPYYLVSGSNYLATNSLLNFRNYAGAPDGIPIPTATGAKQVNRGSAFITWESSVGATGFYIDVALDPAFMFKLGGYTNIYISYDFWSTDHGYRLTGLIGNTVHYYRVKAVTPNGNSVYTSDVNAITGYFKTSTNWFLPSSGELGAMMYNQIGFTAGTVYWSSTQSLWDEYADIRTAIASPPYYNNAIPVLKASSHRVRAARTFESTYAYEPGDASQFDLLGNPTAYIFAEVSKPNGVYTYYECPLVDQSAGSIWSNINTILPAAQNQAIGAGITNTAAIIGQSGHTTSAAKICNDLTTDW